MYNSTYLGFPEKRIGLIYMNFKTFHLNEKESQPYKGNDSHPPLVFLEKKN